MKPGALSDAGRWRGSSVSAVVVAGSLYVVGHAKTRKESTAGVEKQNAPSCLGACAVANVEKC